MDSVGGMGQLLGGSSSPIGWSVQYLQAALADVLGEIRRIRRDRSIDVRGPRPYPGVLYDLLPFEAPWTRELVLPCGEWTAYLARSRGPAAGRLAEANGHAGGRQGRTRRTVVVLESDSRAGRLDRGRFTQ